MKKVGDIVKLKKDWFDFPPVRAWQRAWRWRVEGFDTAVDFGSPGKPNMVTRARLRRLDTNSHRLEHWDVANLVPVSFWEKIWRRY